MKKLFLCFSLFIFSLFMVSQESFACELHKSNSIGNQLYFALDNGVDLEPMTIDELLSYSGFAIAVKFEIKSHKTRIGKSKSKTWNFPLTEYTYFLQEVKQV